jgi:hypothetical protein
MKKARSWPLWIVALGLGAMRAGGDYPTYLVLTLFYGTSNKQRYNINICMLFAESQSQRNRDLLEILIHKVIREERDSVGGK